MLNVSLFTFSVLGYYILKNINSCLLLPRFRMLHSEDNTLVSVNHFCVDPHN